MNTQANLARPPRTLRIRAFHSKEGSEGATPFRIVEDPDTGFPSISVLRDELLIRLGLVDEASDSDAPARRDSEQTYLLRNVTRSSVVPADGPLDGHIENDDLVEVIDRSVAGRSPAASSVA